MYSATVTLLKWPFLVVLVNGKILFVWIEHWIKFPKTLKWQQQSVCLTTAVKMHKRLSSFLHLRLQHFRSRFILTGISFKTITSSSSSLSSSSGDARNRFNRLSRSFFCALTTSSVNLMNASSMPRPSFAETSKKSIRCLAASCSPSCRQKCKNFFCRNWCIWNFMKWCDFDATFTALNNLGKTNFH